MNSSSVSVPSSSAPSSAIQAVAGICLIRLEQLRPRLVPFPLGLASENVHSSYFADVRRLPAGAVAFDCALMMRDLAHEWHALPPLRG